MRVTLQGDRIRLAADVLGADDAPPVLLLHGGGQTRHAWGPTGQKLADAGFRSIALDLRGHGESEWATDGDYRLDRFVADLRAVIGSLRLGALSASAPMPVLVGASLGGIASLVAQGEDSGMTGTSARALVLVDIATTAQVSGIERIVQFMRQKPDGFASLEEVAAAIAAYQPQRTRPTNLDGLAKNVRLGEDGRYRWHWDPAFLAPSAPGTSALRKERLVASARALSVPTLLVRGKLSDVIADEDVAEFLRHVPHAEFVNVRDAGHMVAGDSNDVFSDAVLSFLRRC